MKISFHVESNSGKRIGFLASNLLLFVFRCVKIHRGAGEGLGWHTWLSQQVACIPG